MESLILKNQDHPAITILSLNRPDNRNALNISLMQALCKEIETTQEDPDQRILILHGEGPVFCSGMDLQEATDPSFEKQSAQLIGKMLTTVSQTPLITIAAVHGAALAGGAGLMSVCDFVIAAAGTRCGFPEVKRGLVPAQVAAFLSRQLRWRDLRELLLLGELYDAEHAQAFGLVNRIVPSGELIQAALKLAQDLLKGAPKTLKETKRLLDQLDTMPLQEKLSVALPFHHNSRASTEAHEGIRAFLEKRDPQW